MAFTIMLAIVAALLLVGFTVPVALGASALVGLVLLLPGIPVEALLGNVAADWAEGYVFLVVAFLVMYGNLAAAMDVPARLAGTITAMLGRGRVAAAFAEALAAIVIPDARGDLLLNRNDEASASVNRLRLSGHRHGASVGLASALTVLRVVMPPGLLVVLAALVTETSVFRSFSTIWLLALAAALALFVLGALAGGSGERNETAEPSPVVLVWLIVPFAFLVPIMSGAATPAEAAAVIVVLALLIGLLELRLTGGVLLRAGFDAVRDAGALMAVLMFAQVFSMAVAFSGTTMPIAETLASWPVTAAIVVAFGAFCLASAFIGAMATLFLLGPLLLPALHAAGLDGPPIVAAASLALALGTIVPPVGSVFATLTVGSTRRARAAIGSIAVFALPLVAMLVVALVLPAPRF